MSVNSKENKYARTQKRRNGFFLLKTIFFFSLSWYRSSLINRTNSNKFQIYSSAVSIQIDIQCERGHGKYVFFNHCLPLQFHLITMLENIFIGRQLILSNHNDRITFIIERFNQWKQLHYKKHLAFHYTAKKRINNFKVSLFNSLSKWKFIKEK